MRSLTMRSLAARPLLTALTTLSIVLGVALVVGALTLTDTQRRASASLSSAAYDGTAAVVSAPTAFAVDSGSDWAVQRPTVDAGLVDRVRALPEVGLAVGDVTDQNARITAPDGTTLGEGPYFGIGLDARAPDVERVTPFRLDGGRWAAGPGEVVIDAGTAKAEGLGVGSRVRVSGRGAAQAFTVVGLARFGAVDKLGKATAAVFDLRTAQGLFGRGAGVDGVLVAAREGVSAERARAAVAAAVGDAGRVEAAATHDRFAFDGLEQFISIIRIVLLAFGGIAVLVGALTIVNSLSMTVAQRTRELALLRLVGARRGQVLRGVLAGALLLGVAGSLAGIALGLGIAKGLEGLFTSLGLELPQSEMVVATGTVVAGLVVGTLTTLLAGLVPAVRATRVAPVVALRDAGAATGRAGILGRVVSPLVSVLARPAERIGGVAGLLARRNALRRPGRTASTAAALTIGVALVTLVAVVAAGLRSTTEGGLERRVAATHVVQGADGWSPTDPSVAAALGRAPGVSAVTQVRQDAGQAFGDVERVNTVLGGLLRFDREAGAVDPAALGRDGAIVDAGWAAEHGLGVGARFALTAAGGGRLALTVRGIERSPVLDGLDLGPITVAPAAYDAVFAGRRNLLTLVDARDGAAVERALAPFPDAAAMTRDAFVTERMAPIDTLMAIFAVLLALAVIVSLFGIVNALVLATFERRRELGMLAAIGMSRRQVRRMVRHESVVTALLGAVTGVAAGLGLGGLVSAAFADQGLAFAVPGGTLVVLAVVAVLAGVLAAVLPARRAARLGPLTALAYE